MRTTKDIMLEKRSGARRTSEARPRLVVLLLLGLFPLLLIELVPIPTLTAFEWTVYDAQMRVRNELLPRSISDSIMVIGVSDTDEERLDSDLARRQSYIELLNRLNEWGARTITFDLFFMREEPTDSLFANAIKAETLPAILAYHFKSRAPVFEPEGSPPPELAEFQEMARYGQDAEALEQGVKRFDDYLLQLRAFQKQNAGEGQSVEFFQRIAWARHLRNGLLRRWFWLTQGHEFDPARGGNPYEALDLSLLSPLVMVAPQSLGFANVEKGEQDVVRKVPLVYSYRERLFPHLSLATALEHFGVSFSQVEINWGRNLSFETPAGQTVAIPIDQRGRYLVNFREGEEYLNRNPTLSAVVLPEFREEVFGEKPAGHFRDHFVIVGEVISGGMATDIEPVPIQNKFPMVGLHANILDNLLRQDFLYRASPSLRFAISCLSGLVLALLYYFQSFYSASRLAVLYVLAYVAIQFFLYMWADFGMDLVKPLVGMIGAVFLFFGYVIVVKDRDRRLVRDVFLRSVSPRIGEEILKNYHDEAIWGATRRISILFIDIRGYTTLSESNRPDKVLAVLDTFYDTASEIIFRHEGQVNKFLGDAVLALFGALPEEPPNHAERAVRAAAEIQAAMRQANARDLEPMLGTPIETGAGVNTGVVTVGLVGRRRIRIEYTALGDAVNIASRLQTLASEGEVVLGKETVDDLGGSGAAVFEEMGLQTGAKEHLTVKGKKEPLPVYRVALRNGFQLDGISSMTTDNDQQKGD